MANIANRQVLLKLRYREDGVEGLERAPRAFLGLFRGENFGKLRVRVGDDPTLAKG
jgi:NADPH-dependent curcumin reductase CurA